MTNAVLPGGSGCHDHPLSCSLLRPMTDRTILWPVPSIQRMDVESHIHPQLPKAKTRAPWRIHRYDRVLVGKHFDARRGRCWKSAGQTSEMRVSHSGGPPVMTLIPRTVKSSSACRTVPATTVAAGLLQEHGRSLWRASQSTVWRATALSSCSML